MDRVSLAPGYEISRVIRGNWQMAEGHGTTTSADPIGDMVAFADAGITTFDCADIYTGVEELIGRFRTRYLDLRGAEALARIAIHTKFVPDLDLLARITRTDVERAIDRSLSRLGMDRLDLVQFHWWNYEARRLIDTAGWLSELQRKGKIRHLGGTNFDTAHLVALVDSGMRLVAMQVQYSLLDDRPAARMAAQAEARGVKLLCYGTVAGGFLSERWLGAREPADTPENRSLVKYKLMIDDRGGWDAFQALLAALAGIAARHDSDIATVASAAMLARPAVAGVIVGARDRAHLAANGAIGTLRLDEADRAAIAAATAAMPALGDDVYERERDREGRHGAIMKYNLSKGAA